MEWCDGIEILQPYIVHISTPRGSGTGWLVSVSRTTDLVAVATAAHVLEWAHSWEAPIRLRHHGSEKPVVVRPEDRAIYIEDALDSAALVFRRGDLGLPTEILPLMDTDFFIRPGVEIGWMGFPAVHQSDVCFFSGRISCFVDATKRYLVDGVAINGVSGGPAFRLVDGGIEMLGIVSAYMPNRATGEPLPGLAVIQDVSQFHDIAQRFRSVDDAKSSESPPDVGEASQEYADPAGPRDRT
jgi:hypothetical protein